MRATGPNTLSNPNRIKGVLAPALIAAIAVSALAGCAPSGASPEHTTSASSTPSPEASQPAGDRYEGSDFERKDALPSDLEAADKATPEEFAQLPKAEQIRWATWAGQYKTEFIEYFSLVSTLPQDAPYTLTAESDAKALIVDRSYEQRIAANFGSGTPDGKQDNGPIDRDMAEKYITAFTIMNDEAQAKIDAFTESVGDDQGRAINSAQQAVTHIYDASAEIAASQDFTSITNTMVIDGETISGFRVSWTAADGSGSSNYNIGAYSTVDYKNQPIVVAVVGY